MAEEKNIEILYLDSQDQIQFYPQLYPGGLKGRTE